MLEWFFYVLIIEVYFFIIVSLKIIFSICRVSCFENKILIKYLVIDNWDVGYLHLQVPQVCRYRRFVDSLGMQVPQMYNFPRIIGSLGVQVPQGIQVSQGCSSFSRFFPKGLISLDLQISQIYRFAQLVGSLICRFPRFVGYIGGYLNQVPSIYPVNAGYNVNRLSQISFGFLYEYFFL